MRHVTAPKRSSTASDHGAVISSPVAPVIGYSRFLTSVVAAKPRGGSPRKDR